MAFGQQQTGSDFDISKDKENGAVVYKGQCTFEDLQKESSFGWLDRGTNAYKPDSNAVKYLKKHLGGYDLVILMGTWCEDSQNLLPKLRKTLQAAAYPMSKLSMYGVDRAKTAKNVEHRLYKLEKVPTIVVYKNYMEVGRIVETVKKSIEADLMAIVKGREEGE
jgi:hypothetical protein